MSGLCPPVPTELVSVFYLKTGSVQQEQEWSPLTSRIRAPFLDLHGSHSEATRLRFIISSAELSCLVGHTLHRAVWGVSLEPLALMKIKPEPSNLSDDGTEP